MANTNTDKNQNRVFRHTCVSTSNLRVQKALLATHSISGTISSNAGDLSGCNITTGNCTKEHDTFVWEAPTNTSFCPYVEAGVFQATLTEKIVVIPELQGAFIFADRPLPDLPETCVPRDAHLMENHVVMQLAATGKGATAKRDASNAVGRQRRSAQDISVRPPL